MKIVHSVYTISMSLSDNDFTVLFINTVRNHAPTEITHCIFNDRYMYREGIHDRSTNASDYVTLSGLGEETWSSDESASRWSNISSPSSPMDVCLYI